MWYEYPTNVRDVFVGAEILLTPMVDILSVNFTRKYRNM